MSLQICSNHTFLDSTSAPPCTIQDIKNELAKYKEKFWLKPVLMSISHAPYEPLIPLHHQPKPNYLNYIGKVKPDDLIANSDSYRGVFKNCVMRGKL